MRQILIRKSPWQTSSLRIKNIKVEWLQINSRREAILGLNSSSSIWFIYSQSINKTSQETQKIPNKRRGVPKSDIFRSAWMPFDISSIKYSTCSNYMTSEPETVRYIWRRSNTTQTMCQLSNDILSWYIGNLYIQGSIIRVIQLKTSDGHFLISIVINSVLLPAKHTVPCGGDWLYIQVEMKLCRLCNAIKNAIKHDLSWYPIVQLNNLELVCDWNRCHSCEWSRSWLGGSILNISAEDQTINCCLHQTFMISGQIQRHHYV